MMDDPNITMEEYIKLQAENTQRHGWMFNWQAATYGKIYCDDHDYFIDFEADYPAIVYDDALTLNENVSLEPTINMALPTKDQINQYLMFEGLEYSEGDITDFKERLGKRYCRGVHQVQVLDFKGLTDAMAEGDFLGTVPFYTAIRDLMLRSCHRLIVCSITGKSQAPKKVTVTDLFYLWGMDVDSINIHYRLARYLRRFASRRKQGPNAVAGAPEVAKDAPNVDEGA
nr:hypothetical protein [Tanacetum cinerariifolium]